MRNSSNGIADSQDGEPNHSGVVKQVPRQVVLEVESFAFEVSRTRVIYWRVGGTSTVDKINTKRLKLALACCA